MKIVVISTPACANCQNTKNLLKFSGLAFESQEVQRETPEFEALVAEGVRTFPVVDVFNAAGTRIDRWTGFKPENVSALARTGLIELPEIESAGSALLRAGMLSGITDAAFA